MNLGEELSQLCAAIYRKLCIFINKIFKMATTGLFSVYFRSPSNKHYNSYNKLKGKMSLQYMALVFKPTTFRLRVSSHYH